ncbi:MAG: Lrp/AsnC family transcriptional regulator, partial [Nanoarchaeota archaeon]
IMLHRKNIEDYKIGIYSPIYHFTRTIISPQPEKEHPKVMTLGGKDRIDNDKDDIIVLKELTKNVRTPIISIAKKIGKSPQSVARRIKNLEKNGVIQGYRPLFNWDLLGYLYFKIDVHLEDYKRKEEMFQFCRQHPNIIQVNQVIGGSDFEFEIFAKDKKQFQLIMQNFQSKFSDVITNYDYFTVKKPYKETFMAL